MSKQPVYRTANASFQVLSFADTALKVRDCKKRKAHTKAKTGCTSCRAKRVKCDETKPECRRCERNCRPCLYTSQNGEVMSEADCSNTAIVSMCSIFSAETLLSFSIPTAMNGTESIYILQHAERHWSSIFHLRHSDIVLPLFASSAVVRHTFLALAACHLRHMSPNNVQHRVAEHFYQALALKDYQIALNTSKAALSQDGVNTMLLSAVLLNVLAFASLQSESSNEVGIGSSWVFRQDAEDLGWLGMQAGLRPLMNTTAPHIGAALHFLRPLFLEAGTWTFTPMYKGIEDMPELWTRAFRLLRSRRKHFNHTNGDLCPVPNEVFRPALSVLASLRNAKIHTVDSFKHLQFLGKMHPDFRRLMYEKDERALWIFGYWLGLLRQKGGGIWWFDGRAKRDFEAIRLYLHQGELKTREGEEGEIWRAMIQEYDSLETSDVELESP